MELENSYIIENNSKSNFNKISLLNKIKHKPLLIEKIFPFTLNRPFIYPFIVDHYPLLKFELRATYKSLKKNNKLSNDINKIFIKFIIYRILYQSNFDLYLQNLDYIMQFNYYFTKLSYLEIYRHIFEVIFVKKEIIKKENFNYFTFGANVPKGQGLDNFIIDYFQYHKKLYLFFSFLEEDFKDKINMNIEYFEKIKINNKYKFEVDIFFIFNEIKSKNKYDFKDNYIKFGEYFKINNIYFVISQEYNSPSNTFLEQMYNFVNIISNDNNINNVKKIIFDKSFLRKKEINKNISYLEILANEIFITKNKIQFPLVDEINFYESFIYYHVYKRYFLSYNLYSFFSKEWDNLIIITPNDFNNIKNKSHEEIKNLKNKLNKFENNEIETDLKILLIDFENNSPYQENFIYFVNNIIGYNESINNLFIRNIGKINYDIEYYNFLKSQKPEKLFPNLINVVYENNKKKTDINNYIIGENVFKEFLNLFFCIDKYLFISEIYISQNNLKYIFFSKIFNFDDILFSFINLEKPETIITLKYQGIIYRYKLSTGKLYLSNSSTTSSNNNEISNILANFDSKVCKIKDIEDQNKFKQEINIFNYFIKNIKIHKELNILLERLKSVDEFFHFKKINEVKEPNNNLLKILDKYKKNILVIIQDIYNNFFGAYKNFSGKKNDNGFVYIKDNIYFTGEKDYGFISFKNKQFGVKNYFHIYEYANEQYKIKIDSKYIKEGSISHIENIEIYE